MSERERREWEGKDGRSTYCRSERRPAVAATRSMRNGGVTNRRQLHLDDETTTIPSWLYIIIIISLIYIFGE